MKNQTLKILLVDDNQDDRVLVLRELSQEFPNLEAVQIRDKKQFEAALKNEEFNLVITDYQLRWITGLWILRQVKEQKPDCPVIMFTGTGNEEVAVEAMKSGLDDYVIKSPRHFLRLAKIVRSIWEREQQRQALEEVENRYFRLFEEVPVGLYRLTPTGTFMEANYALVKMLGYPNVEELLKSNFKDCHREPILYEEWKNKINSEEVVKNLETQLRRWDNSIIWVRHNARAIRDGELLYYEGALEDVTDEKQAQTERDLLLQRERKARAEAETANRVKDEFLATLSHELRTPLNAMLGWVQLLRRDTLNPSQITRALEIIQRNAEAQNQLIEDLLDVSRIIRGKMQLNMVAINPYKVIKIALDTMRPAAQAKEMELISDLNPNVGLVSADSDRLQQIVWNLLVNAVKFTPKKGTITVKLENNEDNAKIQVSDTGQGIAPDFLPHVFERFNQVENTSKRSYGGLGLGLAIVRHLVELHGGTVAVDSPGEGKGATFTVELPLVKENQTSLPPQANLEGKQDLPSLQELEVLLVEDEQDAVEFSSFILEECGAKVTAVGSVAKAREAMSKNLPDILISDIAMAGEDGYDLIRQVRANEKWKDIPAIALTAYASDKDKQLAKEAGFQVHLSKPIDPLDLVEAVANLVISYFSEL